MRKAVSLFRLTAFSDVYKRQVKDKRTVIFCASVKHAQEIAGRLHDAGVAAEAVSGEIKASDRREVLARFEKGEIKVLCACDLLNEGWDCPATEVLFMARPTTVSYTHLDVYKRQTLFRV